MKGIFTRCLDGWLWVQFRLACGTTRKGLLEKWYCLGRSFRGAGVCSHSCDLFGVRAGAASRWLCSGCALHELSG